MKYSFNIDEKSLYKGVKNDYSKGQTATVHTPLNQSKDEKKWRNDIFDCLNEYKSENVDSLPETLRDKCLKQTTSYASGKIVGFYVFSKFSLDGIPFEADSSFAMYIKEETSEYIVKRDGTKTANTHLGRKKLHYPLSLAHIADGYNIDNNKVLKKILEENGGFAYIVNGFDVDTELRTLNFKTTMIGPEGVLLSNVFKRKKGVGLKLLVDGINLDKPIIESTAKKILTNEESKTFITALEKIQESSRSNGRIGEEYVFENIHNIFGKEPEVKLHISKKYPLSPYDIECIIDGEKIFIEVKSTEKEIRTFYMSKGERKFMDKYEQRYLLVLVTNVKSNHKRTFKYKRKEIEKMKQEHQGIKYTAE